MEPRPQEPEQHFCEQHCGYQRQPCLIPSHAQFQVVLTTAFTLPDDLIPNPPSSVTSTMKTTNTLSTSLIRQYVMKQTYTPVATHLALRPQHDSSAHMMNSLCTTSHITPHHPFYLTSSSLTLPFCSQHHSTFVPPTSTPMQITAPTTYGTTALTSS